MPRPQHFYGLNHLNYLTTSTYRRSRGFDAERFKRQCISTWSDLRSELGFRIVGYVLMPEHLHVLLGPSQLANPFQIMQKLEERTAKFILKNLRQNRQYPWCEEMLGRLKRPSTVHDQAHHRVGQRRFYDMNIGSEKKRLEKLNYMHNNPVKRGLVKEPGDWPWSSWRYYYLGDASLLAVDRMPRSGTGRSACGCFPDRRLAAASLRHPRAGEPVARGPWAVQCWRGIRNIADITEKL